MIIIRGFMIFRTMLFYLVVILISGCNSQKRINNDNEKFFKSLRRNFSFIEEKFLTEYCAFIKFNQHLEKQLFFEKGCLEYQIPICCHNSFAEYYLRSNYLRKIDQKICKKYGILTFRNYTKYYCSDRISYSLCENLKQFKKSIKSALNKCKSGNEIYCEYAVSTYQKVNSQGKKKLFLDGIDKDIKGKINILLKKTKNEEKIQMINLGYFSKLLSLLIKRKVIAKTDLSKFVLKEYESNRFEKNKNLTLNRYIAKWNRLNKKFKEYNIQKEDCKNLLYYNNWRKYTDNIDYIKKLCVEELAQKGCINNWSFRDTALDYQFFKNLIPLKNLRDLTIQIDEGKVDQEGIILLHKLSTINDLGFRKIKLPGKLFKRLRKLEKLERLSLFDLEIAPKYLNYIGQYKNLKYLQLYKMNLSLEFVKKLKSCKQLKELDFINCNLTDSMLKEVCKIKNLNSIILDSNSLTDTGAHCINNLKQLNSIIIQNNNLSNKTMEALIQKEKINYIGIYNTKVNLEFLKKFKGRNNKIQIRNENYKLNNYFIKGDKPENVILIDYEDKKLLFRIFYKNKYDEIQVKWKRFNTETFRFNKMATIIKKMMNTTFPKKYKNGIYF